MKRKFSKDYTHGEPICYFATKAVPTPEPRSVERLTVREVHHLAIAALRHFAKHGDSTLMTRLIQSLVTPLWRRELLQWCSKHAGIPWDSKRNGFQGGSPKDGVRLLAAERERFRTIPKRDLAQLVGVRVDILWSAPYESLRPCATCGARSLPGEHTCYGHHNK